MGNGVRKWSECTAVMLDPQLATQMVLAMLGSRDSYRRSTHLAYFKHLFQPVPYWDSSLHVWDLSSQNCQELVGCLLGELWVLRSIKSQGC